MIFKAMVRRHYERMLRSQGNAKAWAIKQASMASTKDMLAALPLHVRIKIVVAACFVLTLDKCRCILGVRSGK